MHFGLRFQLVLDGETCIRQECVRAQVRTCMSVFLGLPFLCYSQLMGDLYPSRHRRQQMIHESQPVKQMLLRPPKNLTGSRRWPAAGT